MPINNKKLAETFVGTCGELYGIWECNEGVSKDLTDGEMRNLCIELERVIEPVIKRVLYGEKTILASDWGKKQ